MRYVVLIFGLLGVASSGSIAFKWSKDWLEMHKVMDEVKTHLLNKRDSAEKSTKTSGVSGSVLDPVEAYFRIERTLPFLVSGTLFGLLGSILSFKRYGYCGAALMLVAGAVPPLLCEPFLFVFTGTLLFSGFLALFVRPLRPKAPEPEDEPEAEEALEPEDE